MAHVYSSDLRSYLYQWNNAIVGCLSVSPSRSIALLPSWGLYYTLQIHTLARCITDVSQMYHICITDVSLYITDVSNWYYITNVMQYIYASES